MSTYKEESPPSPAKHVLVISPAGRIYDHDNVQWYKRTEREIIDNYFNIGDMVVYDSTLKLLNYENAEGMEIINTSNYDIERYKRADYAIIRASNFIHNEMKWHRAAEILEKTQLPVYAIGVGGQAPSKEDYKLNEENLRFWKIVSERSKLIGVRGCFTAELLYDNGIKNVEIVGCPSIFRTRNRNLNIKAPDDIKNVAFSIRREVDVKYSDDIYKYISTQREFLLNCARKFNTTITIHGENEEKAFYYGDELAIKKAKEILFRERWFIEESASELEKLYREKLFFFLRVEDYDSFIRSQDFAVGYRVHGVLPAISNGIPGVLVKYDTRSTELADTLAIPSIIVNDIKPENISNILMDASFDDFNKIYPIRYDKMKFVMDVNGIAHRL